MQSGPDLSTTSDVLALSAPDVRVSGTKRGVISWSVDREIPTDLPAQVVSGSGVTAAGATVDWEQVSDVTSRAASAFARSGGWPPKGGEPVTLTAGYEGAPFRLFTGLLDDVDGGSDGSMSSRLVDRVPALDRTVTFPPFAALGVPLSPTAPRQLLGLRPETLVNKCFRASGFWATPPPTGNLMVDAPMMGSLAPENSPGTVNTATPWDTAQTYRTSQAPGARWGLSMSDFRVDYTIPAANQRALGSGVFLTSFMVDPATTDYVTVTNTFTGGTIVVQQFPTRITVNISGALVVDHTVSAGSYDRVAMTLNGHTVTLRTGMSTLTGGDQISEATVVASSIPAGNLTTVRVTAMPNARVAGVQVGWPVFDQMWRPITFQRTARFQVGYLHQSIAVSPAVEARNALDFVNEIAAAMCAAFWIDEYGAAEWRHPDMLRSIGTVSKDITSSTSLVELSWRDSLAMLRSRVVLTGDEPYRGFARGTPDATVWTGSGENIAPGESIQYILTPPNDETWIGVAGPKVLASSADFPEFHANRDSWVFGVADINNTESWDGFEVAKSWSQIGVQAWKLVVLNQLASYDVVQRVPDTLGMHPRYRGDKGPIIRAVEKTTWVTEEITAAANPDSTLPELTHEVGRWVQAGDRQRLADWLAGQLANPIPEITNLQIIPDPRLQLGDRVRVIDPEVADLNVEGIVVGITISGGPSALAMTITVRVVTVSAGLVTYLMVQGDNTGQTYAQDQTEWASDTYATHQANPLAK